MLRPLKYVPDASLLHDTALPHDHKRVADLTEYGEVMADKNVRQVKPLFEFPEQAEHLGLYRQVKGRYRLIEYQQFRLNGQRAGDTDPLALPS